MDNTLSYSPLKMNEGTEYSELTKGVGELFLKPFFLFIEILVTLQKP